jgi:hypothetical protein
MQVRGSEFIDTQYGQALRILLRDLNTGVAYSFMVSGQVFTELWEEHVTINDVVKIYLNEKQHWRFEFIEKKQ